MITDNTLPPAIPGLPNEPPSVFSDEKGKRGVATCHAIYLTHVDVLVFPEDMMWKNSKARFKFLCRRWLREFEGGEKILLFQASHNCQRPSAKIKCHGIEEGL